MQAQRYSNFLLTNLGFLSNFNIDTTHPTSFKITALDCPHSAIFSEKLIAKLREREPNSSINPFDCAADATVLHDM
jgi:hypothetical protein